MLNKDILDTYKPQEIELLEKFTSMCETCSNSALLDAFLKYHEEQRHRGKDLEFEAYLIARREILSRMRKGKESL
jgi:hypothetical protein